MAYAGSRWVRGWLGWWWMFGYDEGVLLLFPIANEDCLGEACCAFFWLVGWLNGVE